MSEKAHPEEPNATFLHQEQSPTAATVGNPLYKASGPMVYRVTLSNGSAMSFDDIEASGGDDAAAQALAQHPGCKVAHVEPAPRKAA